MDNKKENAEKKPLDGRCETCEFFEDDGFGEASCAMPLDEDEFAQYAAGKTGNCPYYRYYDEYKTVQKQN